MIRPADKPVKRSNIKHRKRVMDVPVLLDVSDTEVREVCAPSLEGHGGNIQSLCEHLCIRQ